MHAQKHIFLLLSVAVTAVIVCADIYSGKLIAEESQQAEPASVIIQKSKSGGIDPSVLTVKPGQNVVWRNRNQEPAKIVFTDALSLTCRPPHGFYADLLGNYESDEMFFDGSADLCFADPGEYAYEVVYVVRMNQQRPVEMIDMGKVVVAE
jgi:plastocyanin